MGSAAARTALGALAGAALGSLSGHMGTGAAVGAGTGLVAGSAVGAGNARAAGGSLQARYDTVYAQCMAGKGNRAALLLTHASLCADLLARGPVPLNPVRYTGSRPDWIGPAGWTLLAV